MPATTTSKDVLDAGPERRFSFMRWRGWGFAVTFAIFLATTASLSLQGLNLGLDFTGGVVIEASRAAPFDAAALRVAMESTGLPEVAVQLADGGTTAFISTNAVTDLASADPIVRAITAALPEGAALERTEAISAKVSGELLRGGLLAAGLAVVLIALYVWFRFESKFGFGALITTFHDVYVILGLFSITRLTFDLTTIAAILAIAGYSINDTVIVYDRIREMLKKHRRTPLPQIIDLAVNATLSRTIVTSGTTLLTSLAILLLGGPVLFGFAAAISFGIFVGTFSSIFVAAPMLIHLPGKTPGEAPAVEKATV
jgi:preprotein translocase SecF subunit